MGYWTASDLSQLMPQPVLGQPLISGSSYPVTMGGFQTIINEISAQVDAAIAAAGYAAPVASSAVPAFDYVRLVTTFGARWRALIDMGAASLGQHDQQAYYRELALIAEGKMPLPGAPADTSESGRILPRHGGVPSAQFTPTWFP